LRINVIFGMKKIKNVNGGDKNIAGGDRTGPMGRGPMTGRALGFCQGNPTSGYTTPGYGQGFFRGWSRDIRHGFRGRGWRFCYRDYYDIPYNQPSKENEKEYLENLVKNLEEELKAIKDRLQDLSK
jgi:hypothetical protein